MTVATAERYCNEGAAQAALAGDVDGRSAVPDLTGPAYVLKVRTRTTVTSTRRRR